MVVINGKEAVAVDENTALVTVKVSPSKKGKGVFAARNIPPYEFLAAYPGFVYADKNYEQKRFQTYGVSFFKMDGANVQSGWTVDPGGATASAGLLSPFRASFAPLVNEPGAGEEANVMWVWNFVTQRVELWTQTPVARGQELLVCYGGTYRRNYNTACRRLNKEAGLFFIAEDGDAPVPWTKGKRNLFAESLNERRALAASRSPSTSTTRTPRSRSRSATPPSSKRPLNATRTTNENTGRKRRRTLQRSNSASALLNVAALAANAPRWYDLALLQGSKPVRAQNVARNQPVFSRRQRQVMARRLLNPVPPSAIAAAARPPPGLKRSYSASALNTILKTAKNAQGMRVTALANRLNASLPSTQQRRLAQKAGLVPHVYAQNNANRQRVLGTPVQKLNALVSGGKWVKAHELLFEMWRDNRDQMPKRKEWVKHGGVLVWLYDTHLSNRKVPVFVSKRADDTDTLQAVFAAAQKQAGWQPKPFVHYIADMEHLTIFSPVANDEAVAKVTNPDNAFQGPVNDNQVFITSRVLNPWKAQTAMFVAEDRYWGHARTPPPPSVLKLLVGDRRTPLYIRKNTLAFELNELLEELWGERRLFWIPALGMSAEQLDFERGHLSLAQAGVRSGMQINVH